MAVNLAYNINNGRLVFPATPDIPTAGGFDPADSRKFSLSQICNYLTSFTLCSFEDIS